MYTIPVFLALSLFLSPSKILRFLRFCRSGLCEPMSSVSDDSCEGAFYSKCEYNVTTSCKGILRRVLVCVGIPWSPPHPS